MYEKKRSLNTLLSVFMGCSKSDIRMRTEKHSEQERGKMRFLMKKRK